MRTVCVLVAMLATLGLATSAGAQAERSDIDPPVWDTISRFRDDAEFNRYLNDVRSAARRARSAAYRKQAEDECPPDMYPCVDASGDEEIVVTGSRLRSPSFSSASPVTTVSATSVTNTQNAGVDEGDIVKMYGRFLIVLQDGRLFSADTGRRNGELALVDRIDVYRDRRTGGWYDEILVSDNRIVVTGYNYTQAATEYSVFSISRDGRFTREATYFLSSADYYDTENYASRLVNGNLVIYTPLPLANVEAGTNVQWPIVRRWTSAAEDGRRANTTNGRNLFDARAIYRPIQATYAPTVHTISVCPLGSERAGDEMECNSTAVVAPPGREFYVSTEHIYLWTYPLHDGISRRLLDCSRDGGASFEAAAPSTIFRIPLAGGAPRAVHTRGRPWDQLGMDASTDEGFRALAVWRDDRCVTHRQQQAELPLRYVSLPFSSFAARPQEAPRDRFTQVPSVGMAIENRFTDTHLVYAGRSSWYSYAPQPNSTEQLATRAVALRTSDPRVATSLDVQHNALRVERVGDDIIVSGYRDWRGLTISLIDLDGTPRIGSSAFMAERYETEGRSHAFNAAVDPDGRGIMGLPTQQRRVESGRWWWRSASSDVSFLTVNNGQLESIGAVRGLNPKHPDYRCEVSCIDWYGNTRALFISGRIFALSGTELIEAEIEGREIHDIARLNLTQPPQAMAQTRRGSGMH